MSYGAVLCAPPPPPPLSVIPWQTPLSSTLYFVDVLMGLASTLVHRGFLGLGRGGIPKAPAFTLQPCMAEEAPEASPSPLFQHGPSLQPLSSLSLSLSIFFSLSARPKGFCQIELNQCGLCGPRSQPVYVCVCVCSLGCPYTEICSQPRL